MLVYETIKQREKMIRMLMRRTDENTLSSKDSVMSNGMLPEVERDRENKVCVCV